MAGSIIIAGFDTGKINWYAVGYVILSIFAVVYGTSKLNPLGGVRAIIYAIGASLIFIYFGFRWFTQPNTTPKQWPPVINMCPDYLTYVPNIEGATSTSGGVCIDLLGVSTAGLTKLNKSETTNVNLKNSKDNATKVFKFTSADVNASTMPAHLQTICDYCRVAGVTWEGVYDGDACIPIKGLQEKKDAIQSCLVSV